MIINGKFTSVWADEGEIETSCKVNTDTHEVFDIEIVDPADYGMEADCKADEHTDDLGQYTLGNDSIVEFIVHSPTLIPNISNRWGNTGDVSTLGGIFEGEIAYIRMYFD